MKKLLSTAVAGGLLCASGAYASDGTITFAGMVTASTCTIGITSSNGGTTGSASPTVTLPTMTVGSLATSGNTAGNTTINFALSSCTTGGTSASTLTGTVKALFEIGPNVDSSTGNLKNTVNDGGNNVQLQLLNDKGTVIKLGDADTMTSATIASDGKATLNYAVRYIANGKAATAGAVSSSVTYSLIYP